MPAEKSRSKLWASVWMARQKVWVGRQKSVNAPTFLWMATEKVWMGQDFSVTKHTRPPPKVWTRAWLELRLTGDVLRPYFSSKVICFDMFAISIKGSFPTMGTLLFKQGEEGFVAQVQHIYSE